MCQLLAFLLLAAAPALAQTTSPVIDRTDMPAPVDTLRLSVASPVLPAGAPLSRRPASETFKEAYHLAKLYADSKGGHPRLGALDSLATTGPDVVTPGFSTLAVYLERVEDAYYYDAAKQLVLCQRN